MRLHFKSMGLHLSCILLLLLAHLIPLAEATVTVLQTGKSYPSVQESHFLLMEYGAEYSAKLQTNFEDPHLCSETKFIQPSDSSPGKTGFLFFGIHFLDFVIHFYSFFTLYCSCTYWKTWWLFHCSKSNNCFTTNTSGKG